MKSFGNVCYVLGIVVAIGIGMWQVGMKHNEGNFQEGGELVKGCRFTGYSERGCSGNVSACSSGNYKIVAYIETQTADFQPSYNWLGILKQTARGDCSGTSDCSTPKSPDLASSGCGG